LFHFFLWIKLEKFFSFSSCRILSRQRNHPKWGCGGWAMVS
jgi:hypothetical protein